MDDIHRALLVDIAIARGAQRALGAGRERGDGQPGCHPVVGYLFWFDRVPDVAFAVTGGLMALAILVTVLGVREPAPAVWAADRQVPEQPDLSRAWRRLHPHPPFAAKRAMPGRPATPDADPGIRRCSMLGLVMFFYWSGVNAVLPLLSVYVRDILGGSVGEAQLLPALMLLSTMLMAIPIGALGDRFGKRRVIGTGAAIIGGAALSGLHHHTTCRGRSCSCWPASGAPP